MKHMGKVHILKYILLFIIAVGVGIGGYEIGLSHNEVSNQTVQSSARTSKLSSDSEKSSSNSISSSLDSDNSNDNGVEKISGNINNYYNEETNTFMGCKTMKEFYSKYGETPCAYLLDKGFSENEIFNMMKQIPNYQQWMSSGEIQEANNN